MSLRKLYLLGACVIAATIICAMLSIVAHGAQGPRGASPARLATLTVSPTLDMNGACLAFLVTARFQSIVAHPSGVVDASEIGSIDFDLVRRGDQSVTIGDTTYSYHEIHAALCAVAAKEWGQAHPPPLPQRKAMRAAAP